MKIQIAVPDTDMAEALTSICLRSKAHWGYPEKYMQIWEPELTVSADMIASGNLMAAFDGGRPVGVAEIAVDRQEGSLEKLFVDPTYMGLGAGRLLFEWSAKRCRELGAEVLLIEADPGAEKFYLRMGAKRIGERASATVPGRKLPFLRYALQEQATS